MRIYVAGSSREIDRVREVQVALRDFGAEITHDWTEAVERWGSRGSALTAEQRAECARADLEDGVAAADVLLVLWPLAGGIGTYIELGFALGLAHARDDVRGDGPCGPTVVISGGPEGLTIWHAFVGEPNALRGHVEAGDDRAILTIITDCHVCGEFPRLPLQPPASDLALRVEAAYQRACVESDAAHAAWLAAKGAS